MLLQGFSPQLAQCYSVCLPPHNQVVRWAVPNLAKMTKLGFLRLSYEKQDTLLKLLILSMAAVLCKSPASYTNQYYVIIMS